MEDYIVLIGSVARNDYLENSDVDICRINTNRKVKRQSFWPGGPINYVDYELDTFDHLYKDGSLFIYHILFEGSLVKGDNDSWKYYKSNFKLKNDYNEEINNILNSMNIYKEIEMFGNHYMSFFSNLFTNVKNFSIFHLANNGQYVFNKRKAVEIVFGDIYFEILSASYNYFERGIVNNDLNTNCKKTAIEIINYYSQKMEELNS